MTRPSAAERFWAKVDLDGPIPPHRPELGPCWVWTAKRTDKGYGQFHLEGRLQVAHRAAWHLADRTVPDGLVLDHLCRNRACVRVSHHEPVTQRINLLRGVGVTARNASRTHCPQRHPYDEANTLRSVSRGRRGRRCRTCHAASQRARYHRQRAAA